MEEEKEIDGRKRDVLKAIIEEYIDTALPVSSSEILKKYNMNVSSATIRNDMAALEKLGLIEKTYSSSGRVPSQRGYRYYVDKLIETENLSVEDLKKIRNEMQDKVDRLEDLSKVASQTLSELTHYTSVAIGPDISEDYIKEIKFVDLGPNLLMVLLVTSMGIIKETIIRFNQEVDWKILKDIEKVFKSKLIGKKLSEIDGRVAKYIIEEIKQGVEIAKKILKEINNAINKAEEIYLGGTTKSLVHSEFKEEEAASNFLALLDDEGVLRELLNVGENDCVEIINERGSRIEIYIGDDEDEKQLRDFSIIRLNQKTPKGSVAKIALVGPKRMNYKRVIEVMKEISRNIDKKIESEDME